MATREYGSYITVGTLACILKHVRSISHIGFFQIEREDNENENRNNDATCP
jgi:hypothetical protein